MNVFATAASKEGATGEIAEAIAQALRRRGLDTIFSPLERVEEVRGYDAFVIGSAVYMGRWLEPASVLVRRLGAAASDRPVRLFSTGGVDEDADLLSRPDGGLNLIPQRDQKGGAMTVAPTPLHGRHTPYRLPLVLVAVLVVALIVIVVVLLIRYDVVGGSSSSSAVQGSGVAATQTRELPPFSSVELAGSNNVVVHVGGGQSVVVHADDNLLRHVTTQVHAGNLMIGNTSGSFTTKSPMSVEINVPSLQALTLTGSGVISTIGVKTARLTTRLSGIGVLRASGSATRLDVSLGGSGDAQLEQLAARDVHAVISGSGRIIVRATSSLDAAVPGSGAIIYSGNPAHVTTNITGNGAVTAG